MFRGAIGSRHALPLFGEEGRVGITEAAQTANKLDAAIVGQGYIGKT